MRSRHRHYSDNSVVQYIDYWCNPIFIVTRWSDTIIFHLLDIRNGAENNLSMMSSLFEEGTIKSNHHVADIILIEAYWRIWTNDVVINWCDAKIYVFIANIFIKQSCSGEYQSPTSLLFVWLTMECSFHVIISSKTSLLWKISIIGVIRMSVLCNEIIFSSPTCYVDSNLGKIVMKKVTVCLATGNGMMSPSHG